MVKFDSAEQLTKTLRSKTIKSDEVVEIVDGLDGKSPYFPKGDIFIMDLIVDRWNDQKNSDFRENPKIWALFNRTWVKINDPELLKATFKNLRFGHILKLVLEKYTKDNNDTVEFMGYLNETFELLVQSITTFQLNYESATQIMACIFDICSRTKFEERTSIVQKALNLINYNSHLLKINSKMSSFFTETLLLSILNYITAFETSSKDANLIELMKSYVVTFLFNDKIIGLESSKLLEKFFNGKTISNESAVNFFSIAMDSLSRKNFKQLEPIFLMITKNRDEVAPILLHKLASTKKTLSHEFLDIQMKESLMKTLNKETDEYFDLHWSLLEYTLQLDIELGIKYSNEILDLLVNNYVKIQHKCLGLWTELIKCHISAREFYNFFSKLKTYFTSKEDQLMMLRNKSFSAKISNSLALLSSSQLKELLSEYMTDITSNTLSQISARLFTILLEGFQYLEISSLSEFKPLLSNIFDLEDSNYPEQWAIKFLIMDHYDDIIESENLLSYTLDDNLNKILSENFNNFEVYLFFLKVREFIEYPMKPVESKLMDFLNGSKEKVNQTMYILSNWFTIVNSCFDIENIQTLLNTISQDENLEKLQDLIKDDDIFEETFVVTAIIDSITGHLKRSHNSKVFQMIPIQCFNKNKKIYIIDSISQLDDINKEHCSTLVHLLEFPTFKTKIETDPEFFFKFFEKIDKKNMLSEDIFKCIWNHHSMHSQDSVSQNFMEKLVEIIKSNLLNNGFNETYFFIAYLIAKNENIKTLEEFKSQFISKIPSFISQSNDNGTTAWVLECFYQIMSNIGISSNYKVIKNCVELLTSPASPTVDRQIKSALFLLYSLTNEDDLHFVFAHYISFRMEGIDYDRLNTGMRNLIERTAEYDTLKYNRAISIINMTLNDCKPDLMPYLVEIMVLLIKYIKKDNVIGSKLILRMISIFYTNIDKLEPFDTITVDFVEIVHELCIKKSWIFDQYTLEQLLPLCLDLSYKFVFREDQTTNYSNEDILISIFKLFTALLNIHRVKFNQRFHIINAFYCQIMDYVLNYRNYGLTIDSVKVLSRSIVNYCEPNITGNKTTNKTTSNVNAVKQSLRRHVPIILVKYIELIVNPSSSIENTVRQEMNPAIYAVFDLLSNNELEIVSTLLDGSGRQYLKTLYSDYKKVGKWQEN